MQPGHEVTRGELRAPVGVEDLWPAVTFQWHLQGIEKELSVKAVGELPAVHMPGVEIHDRHQVEESLLQRDVGDVSGPGLIHSRDLPEIDQAGKSHGWIACNRGAGFLVDRLSDDNLFEGSRQSG